MAVHPQDILPFDAQKLLGIAVATPQHPQQRHVGIIYCYGTSRPRMCHLAWHHRLRDEDLPADYQWGESGLDPINRVFMAAYVSLLPQNASVVPYGITTYGPCFDEQGRYVDQPLGFGLTCATFILDVYARRGFNLLREDQWPERADDALWQRLIIEALTTSGASAQHVEAMREHVGAPRFRPEEVAAGCISEEIPISFDDALTLAQEILQDLQTAAS